MVYINEEEVGKLVGIEDAIDAVEEVGRSMASGTAFQLPRVRLRMSDGFLHVMPAALEDQHVFGFKAYSSFKGKARFLVHLFDSESGEQIAIIAADKLGQLRTGAASGVATRILSRENSRTLGLVGSGYQAETQLCAILKVRRVELVNVFSRNFDHARAFCEKMRPRCKARLDPVKDVAEAAACDIVTTITSSNAPVLSGELLRDGCHVNAAGGNTLLKRELDETAVARADLIVIDSREQGEKECGDFLPLLEKGKLHWNDIYDFAGLLGGIARRKTDRDVTLFKSQGIAAWDVALANVIYRRAMERGEGVKLPL